MSAEPRAATIDESRVPTPRCFEPPPRSSWRGIGGAFAASVAFHALALSTLALIVIEPRSGGPRPVPDGPLPAVLLGSLVRPDAKNDPPASAGLPVATLSTASPAPAPRVAPAAASAPATTGGPSWPWAGTPVDVTAPPSMSGSAMVAAGVDFYETRSLVRLGESIERRIRAGFDRDPERQITLKPDVVIGYPLDALEAGVEGTVLVWFVVNTEGEVVEREAVDGPPELAEWTLARLPRLVDKPAYVNRKPVASWMALEVVFSREAAAPR